ncbi:hypothetical protein BOTBODRAFT_31688 [Botryobasidium botryosum FD-172 SS1]|uniref:Uncharacterized protein n=1 Tax=Botryobasidium botryosum (strain FD-172 SS1) TaxID=930990 RepID=A0A067MIM9_BOTB1|nr:hypothetical protein BOTBODRAFT_31688 [Botryobasidium botryosum FD-172 SS1]
MARPAEEAELDMDAIQSNINLSLSLAYDLVSTWMLPPSSKAKNVVNLETEKDLEEYIRRPPRLGVGAPIPEGVSSSNSRESSNLRKKLAPINKRSREEAGVLGPQNEVHDSDDEDSRAGALSKKPRINGGPLSVFEGKKKKKKKRLEDANGDTAPSLAGESPIPSSSTSAANGILLPPFQPEPKRPRKQSSQDPSPPSSSIQPSSRTLPSASPSPSISHPAPTPSPSKGKDLPLDQDALKIPLLNLGLAEVDAVRENGDVVAQNQQEGTTTGKKKRRRKKKKKNKEHVTVGEAS